MQLIQKNESEKATDVYDYTTDSDTSQWQNEGKRKKTPASGRTTTRKSSRSH